jgi:hypothetical protein
VDLEGFFFVFVLVTILSVHDNAFHLLTVLTMTAVAAAFNTPSYRRKLVRAVCRGVRGPRIISVKPSTMTSNQPRREATLSVGGTDCFQGC